MLKPKSIRGISAFKIRFLMLLSSAIFLAIFFSSCGPKQIKLYELKYSRDSVRVWESNPDFKKLIFQFYSPDILENSEKLQLIAYGVGVDSVNCKYVYLKKMEIGPGAFIPKPDTLWQVTDSSELFAGPAIFGNLEITRDQLYKASHHADGTEKDYDFLFCKPQKHSRSNHVWYRIYAAKNGIKVPKKPDDTDDDESLNPRPPAE